MPVKKPNTNRKIKTEVLYIAQHPNAGRKIQHLSSVNQPPYNGPKSKHSMSIKAIKPEKQAMITLQGMAENRLSNVS